jgi:hypothetical protein
MPALLSLSAISLVTAVVLLLAVRYTSDQRRIAAVKRDIRAGLFEIRLFNDDLRAILRAQGEILRHNLTYLRLSLVPLLWVAIPLVLLMGQLQAYYGYDGLQPGESALVKVQVADEAGEAPDVRLAAPAGVRIETPAVWIPSLREAAWRIAAEQPGEHELTLAVNGTAVTKRVSVGDGLARRSPYRLEPGILNWILYPAEPALPGDAPVRRVEVSYADRAIRVLGWDLHWIVAFFVLTLTFAFVLRRPFGVIL